MCFLSIIAFNPVSQKIEIHGEKIKTMSDFAHIHLHSDFSCLDGYGTIEEYSKKASESGIEYLCVTDHGMGAAYPRMIEECAKYDNLTPIFGSEVYVNNNHHLVPNFKNLSDEKKFLVRKNFHLILIAQNNQGYENLVKIISESWINGFYYKPRISWKTLQEYSEGLCCSSACLGSELSQLVFRDKISEAEDLARQYQDVFKDRYFIEVQMIKMEEQDKVNKDLIRISAKLGIPLVVTNDVHYCEKKDSYNQSINLLLNSKGTINNRSGLEFHTDQLWYKTPREMDETWKRGYQNNIPESEYKEAKANTVKICESCDVQVDTTPKFPKIENSDKLMMDFCVKEMKRKGLIENEVYKQRLLKEYKVICEKGYPSYFICVKKIVDYSKSQGWDVGPGRGCFLPNNIVICENDKKNIQNVEINDLVLSHSKNYNKVINKYSYEVDEEIIDIIIEDGRNISCTIDHKIYVNRGDCYIWIKAKHLTLEDNILDLYKKQRQTKIKSILKRKYKGKVYDLEVENDHSYNIDGLAVHNSGAGSLICNLLGITGLDPIKYDLLFERFLSPSRGGKFVKLQFDDSSEIK